MKRRRANPEIAAGPFMPSFSVRRHVELQDGSAEEVHRRLKRELKFGRTKLEGYIVAPEQLCLVILEQRTMVKQMRAAKIHSKKAEEFGASESLTKRIESVAVSLQLGLSKLLQNTPIHMELGLDNPRTLQQGKTIGCQPDAWRGYTANYYRRGSQERPLTEAKAQKPEYMSANELLVAEKNLCVGAVASLFAAEEKPFDTAAFYGEPHIAFVQRNAALKPKQFETISSKLQAIIPEAITLADPVVYLQLERNQEPIQLRAWPREEEHGRLRLVA
jgi:hypothetical protein